MLRQSSIFVSHKTSAEYHSNRHNSPEDHRAYDQQFGSVLRNRPKGSVYASVTSALNKNKTVEPDCIYGKGRPFRRERNQEDNDANNDFTPCHIGEADL